MNENKFSIDELEMLYLTEYDEDSVEESTGDEVQDFLIWKRINIWKILQLLKFEIHKIMKC